MKQNKTRENIAWLAVLAVILMITAGLFQLAGMTQNWLSEDTAQEQVAMQRPAPAQNSVPVPDDIQRQKQQMQSKNPGGWASGGFRMEFTPGPAQKNFDERLEKYKQHKQNQTAPGKPKESPQFRQVDPDETMEEFWTPDYYDEGIDL